MELGFGGGGKELGFEGIIELGVRGGGGIELGVRGGGIEPGFGGGGIEPGFGGGTEVARSRGAMLGGLGAAVLSGTLSSTTWSATTSIERMGGSFIPMRPRSLAENLVSSPSKSS